MSIFICLKFSREDRGNPLKKGFEILLCCNGWITFHFDNVGYHHLYHYYSFFIEIRGCNNTYNIKTFIVKVSRIFTSIIWITAFFLLNFNVGSTLNRINCLRKLKSYPLVLILVINGFE